MRSLDVMRGPNIDHRLHPRRGFTMVELAVVLFVIAILISLLLPAIQQSKGHVKRIGCINNLQQLGIAVESYHQVHRTLPPGSTGPGPVVSSRLDAPYWSWIAQILPSLDQRPIAAKLDPAAGPIAPWHDALHAVFLDLLECPTAEVSYEESGQVSCYVAAHHHRPGPIGVRDSGLLFLNSRVRYRDIQDGRAATLLLGETHTLGGGLSYLTGDRGTLRYATIGRPLGIWQTDAISPATRRYRAASSRPGNRNPQVVRKAALTALEPLTLRELVDGGVGDALVDTLHGGSPWTREVPSAPEVWLAEWMERNNADWQSTAAELGIAALLLDRIATDRRQLAASAPLLDDLPVLVEWRWLRLGNEIQGNEIQGNEIQGDEIQGNEIGAGDFANASPSVAATRAGRYDPGPRFAAAIRDASFSSLHAETVNVLTADGAVHAMRFDVDSALFSSMVHRSDKAPLGRPW